MSSILTFKSFFLSYLHTNSKNKKCLPACLIMDANITLENVKKTLYKQTFIENNMLCNKTHLCAR